jgi:lysophospholipase L1-like esterase
MNFGFRYGLTPSANSSGSGNSGITILPGVAFYGDSMAEGSSGGGSETAYNAFRPTLTRYLSAMGLPSNTMQAAVGGESSTQALSRWAARSNYYKYNIWWAGRNDITNPATPIANANSAINAMANGEIMFVLSVHPVNDGTENVGSTNHNRILQINEGLSNLANNTNVFYVDTLSEFLFSGVLGHSPDTVATANGCPPPTLTSDNLHPSAIGYDVVSRIVFHKIYDHWLISNPRTNLITNGSFDSNIDDWGNFNDSNPYWNNGNLVIDSGGDNWKATGQQLRETGANGKRYMLTFDLLNQDFANWNVRIVPWTGGGSAYNQVQGFGNPMEFGYSVGYETAAIQMARRRGHKITIVADSSDVAVAVLFASANDPNMAIRIDNVVVHEI